MDKRLTSDSLSKSIDLSKLSLREDTALNRTWGTERTRFVIAFQTLIIISLIGLIPSIGLLLTVRNHETILVENVQRDFQKH